MSRTELVEQRHVSLSCVVPVYNEAEVLTKFITELCAYLKQIVGDYEIIIVNDGSKDNTLMCAQGLAAIPEVKLINFSRNFGKEMAITAGLEHAALDTVLIIDADFQHPFDVIPLFLKEWANNYDMVYGLRKNRDDESSAKRFFANSFYKLMSAISQADIPPNAGDFRLLDRKVVNAIICSQERARFMKGLYSWVGFSSKGVVYTVNERAAGQTSWNFTKLFNLAVSGIVSFSDIPLRIWSLVGIFISLLSFLSIGYIFIDTLFLGVDVPGYATLLSMVTFFGGLQLLSVGILGEYIARIFNEVKQRPKYIIESKEGF